MLLSDYWGALSAWQRTGLAAGAALIMAASIGLAVWLLLDPYVPLASGLTTERLNTLVQELDRAKLSYRIADATDAVAVPRSQLGKARAAAALGPSGVPASVGLELFKETDFSSTDFAQKINYQRALQGELTRTVLTISGVRSARVHVILPDAGLFKRNAVKSSAAVSVALVPGKQLALNQVRGIQKLVAASVPDIKTDDVVVLDESGASLSRPVGEAEGDLTSAQLELKRQAEQYLEGKLRRLLQEMVPQGTVSLSVDTVLDAKQLRVTTEEPIATRGPGKDEQATGVLVKERQSQRTRAQSSARGASDAADVDSSDWEYEYKVGHRVEQMLSAPGSIKRVSVAVALQGAPVELTSAIVEQLVAPAVGIDRARGDTVAVVLLPAPRASGATEPALALASLASPRAPVDAARQPADKGVEFLAAHLSVLVIGAITAALLLVGVLLWARRQAQDKRGLAHAAVDVDALSAEVRQWLNKGSHDGRA